MISLEEFLNTKNIIVDMAKVRLKIYGRLRMIFIKYVILGSIIAISFLIGMLAYGVSKL